MSLLHPAVLLPPLLPVGHPAQTYATPYLAGATEDDAVKFRQLLVALRGVHKGCFCPCAQTLCCHG